MSSPTRFNDCGLVYVATQKSKYLVEAVASATSALRHCPDLPVCLFTDMPEETAASHGCFSRVEVVTNETDDGNSWGKGSLSRINALLRSPYTKTLHLDTDTRIVTADIAKVFAFLDTCDIAMIEDPAEVSIGVNLAKRRMLNGGFILFRQNEAINEFLLQWRSLFRQQLHAFEQDPLPDLPQFAGIEEQSVRRRLLSHDQLALTELISPENNRLGLKLSVLDESWNFCKPTTLLPQHGTVKINHGLHLKTDALNSDPKLRILSSASEMLEDLIQDIADAKAELSSTNNEKVVSMLAQAGKRIPNQVPRLLAECRSAMRHGKYEEVQQLAKQAVAKDPQSYQAFFYLAKALILQQQYKEAAQWIHRSRLRLPNHLSILALADILGQKTREYETFVEELGGLTNPAGAIGQVAEVFDTSALQELAAFAVHQRNLASSRSHAPYQTKDLNEINPDFTKAFQKQLLPVLGQYLKTLAQSGSKVFASRPKQFRARCTAICVDAESPLKPEDPEDAWVSALLFTQIPKAKGAMQLNLLSPPAIYGIESNPSPISPTAGAVVIFPGCVWPNLTVQPRARGKKAETAVVYRLDLISN